MTSGHVLLYKTLQTSMNLFLNPGIGFPCNSTRKWRSVLSPVVYAAALDKRSIAQGTFDDLVFYFQYASSAYADSCARPNGNTLIAEFSNALTDTQGFIARDDGRKEIVVSLRGSSSLTDFLVDAELLLIPFVSPGVSPPAGALAHTGFLTAWNSVANTVISTVREQLTAHPGYALVSTGHSLGGALSSLAGISLKQNFPGSSTRMYTYGQPRTFDPIGAKFVSSLFGANAFRSVHTTDGVPTLIPRELGYMHHGVEYFQFIDPSLPATIRQCAASGEDPTCSDLILSMGIDAAHLLYYNIIATTTFCS